MSIFAGVSAGLGGAGSLGTLFIRLTANATDLVKGMDAAVTSVDKSTGVMNKKLAAFGIAAAGVFAGVMATAVKEFADFETSFTGVRKTVDATEAEYRQLSDTFRNMAKQIPANVNDINAVAEAAGQLGIKKDMLSDFTRTMVDLGNTTNLSANDAATALARIANITQMPQTEFKNLGSTIVALGNNLATTEREITDMTLRLAGSGRQVGMTNAQIVSFAGALSSVGIEAEAGGTAVSQLMQKMAKSVAQGSDELTVFARAAGMSANEFAVAFQKDASSAIISFLEGIAKLKSGGEDIFTMFEKMGLDGARMTDVITRASGAGDLFRKSIALGTQAWKDNNALTNEASKRYETFASQIQITLNLFRDMAISLGEGIAPRLKELNKDLQDLLNSSSELSTQLKQNGEILGGAFVFAIKGAITIVNGLVNTLRLVSIVILDIGVYGIKALDKFLDGVKSFSEGVVNSFMAAVNGIIRGGNWLISKLPDPIKKLFGIDPSDKNLIPELDFKLNLDRSSFLKDAEEVMKSMSDDLEGQLAKQFIPQAELKRSMEEVRAAIAAESDSGYDKEYIKEINGMAEATSQLTARQMEQKITLAKWHDQLKALFKDMPDAKQVRGPQTFGFGMGNRDLDEVSRMNQEIKESQDNLDILQTISDEKIDLTDEETKKLLELRTAYNDKLKKLHQAEYEVAITSSQQMFGDLATIAEAFAGKQSGIYKAMFTASKAFAIAESIIKIQQGIAAASSLPWPANLAAMASVVAATANIVSTIQAVKLEFGGAKAAGGPVSAGRTYLVGEKGPELYSPSSNGTIIPNDAMGGVKIVINNYTDAKAAATSREENGEKIIEVTIRRTKNEIASEIAEGRGPVSKSIEQSYGVRRSGK